MARLKVYRTAVGFRDAYVAAPSQAAALRAWGTRKNLFARGAADVVTDADLVQEPMSKPGEVVYRTRGTLKEQVAALGELPRKKAGSRKTPSEDSSEKPTPSKTRKPPPSRAALDKAEKAIADIEARHARDDARLRERERAQAREREDMERRQREELKEAQERERKARRDYERAVADWEP